jgi:hypothetical protein
MLQKSEFAVQLLGFEKLGLELDNCERTTKNAYCCIYSLWPHLHYFFPLNRHISSLKEKPAKLNTYFENMKASRLDMTQGAMEMNEYKSVVRTKYFL